MSLSIQQFAFNVGQTTRKTREAADPFHTAYTGATPTQQSDLRKRWMLGHLDGQGISNPERTLSEGKGKGAKPETIKAIDRASSDFRYMVVRPEPVPTKPVKQQRINKVHTAAAMAFLAEFEGESLEEQIKQALIVLRSL